MATVRDLAGGGGTVPNRLVGSQSLVVSPLGVSPLCSADQIERNTLARSRPHLALGRGHRDLTLRPAGYLALMTLATFSGGLLIVPGALDPLCHGVNILQSETGGLRRLRRVHNSGNAVGSHFQV